MCLFIKAETAFATGIGNELSPLSRGISSLEGYYLTLVKPDIAVSTAEAYANIKPQQPKKCCRDIISQSIDTWKDELKTILRHLSLHITLNLKPLKKSYTRKAHFMLRCREVVVRSLQSLEESPKR